MHAALQHIRGGTYPRFQTRWFTSQASLLFHQQLSAPMVANITGLSYGIVTVGPMPTTFSLTASCADGKVLQWIRQFDTTTWADWRLGNPPCVGTRFSQQPSCLPTVYGDVLDRGDTLLPVFSPGTVCPVGYEPRCTMASSLQTPIPYDATVWDDLRPHETAIGCCPR